MPKKTNFYSDTAAVPAKKRADRAATPGPRLGTQTPTIVPTKKLGTSKGVVQPVRLKQPKHVRGKRRR